jgi:molybdopterin-binding protein
MLEIKNISKNLEDFNLKNLNLSVNKGDYFVLLGISGAGKTILLEIIAGITSPDSGEIFLNKKNITKQKIQKRRIGLVFQDYAVFPHLNVKNNIAYPLKNEKLSAFEKNKQILKLAEEMNITHLLNRKTTTLSGGELQRVALARTLALKPKILLLDEPLASLDIQLKNELRSLLRNINKKGQTIIHVTHDYQEVISLANKIAIINNGSIEQTGTPNEIFQHPKSQFIANFTGIKNFFKAELKNKQAIINNSIAFTLLTDKTKGKGNVLIKSQDIIISENKVESSACNNFKGIITDIIPAPLGIEIFTDIGIQLVALITTQSLKKLNLYKGKNIWISFKASCVKFF